MRVCVIGSGYVGLVTGTCFAEAGNHVVCVDVDEAKIKALNNGEIPIYEPGLKPMVIRNHHEKRLTFTTRLDEAINQSEVAFIAVGTPPNEDGSADLSHVLKVAEGIAKVAIKPVVVGTKSTVPVGTGDKIEALLKEKASFPCSVFSNPEFLKEGDAVSDFMKPDRVIVGINNPEIEPLLRELYAPFMRQRERFIVMSRKSAELTKYAANAMLASRISFMNEMANLCEAVGANINDLRVGIGSDPRIGSAFLYPGLGYGGSCFPKDVKALSQTASEYKVPLRIVDATEKANQAQKEVLFTKICSHFGGQESLKGLTIGLWGLAFKANTDDIRESAALTLIDRLLDAGAAVQAYDPQAESNVKSIYGNRLTYASDAYEAAKGAQALVIATEWNEFRSPDYSLLQSLLINPIIFDGRNLLSKVNLKEKGFVYYGIGV